MYEIVIPSLYMLAGIMVYAMFHHLSIALYSPRDPVQMLFAGMCASNVLFAFFHAQMLQATDVAGFTTALKLNVSAALLFVLLLVWFTGLYSGKRPLFFLVILSSLFGLLFVINLTQPYSAQYDHLEGIRTLRLPWGENVTRGVGVNGFWAYFTFANVAAVFVFMLYALIGKFRASRQLTDLSMLFAVTVFVLFATLGILTRMSVIDFIEPGPIGVIAMVIVMSVALTSENRRRLRTSELRFRSLVEQSPISIQIFSPDGHTQSVNPAWEKLWGVKPEMLGDYNILHDAQLIEKGAMPYIEKGFAGEYTEIPPIIYNPADNQLVTGPIRDSWVRAYIYPIKDKSGTIDEVILMHEDITKRKRIEDTLLESEEKLRRLFELSPLGIALTDMDGRYVEFNKAFQEICGYSEEELKALDYWTLTPRKYEADESRQLESLKQAGYYGPYEKEYQRKDGSLVPLRLNGVLITGSKGQKYIWSIVEDITESKQAEDALRESEIRFRTIIEQSPIGISFSRDGYTIDVNAVFLQMFGYEDIAEVRGLPVVNRIAPQCRAEMEDRIRRRIQGEPTESFYETIGLRRDGSQFPLLISAKRVELSDGPFSCAFLIDITERKASEEKIKQLAYYDHLTDLPNRRLLLDRLQQAMASSGRSGRHGALLCIDLDDFKSLNDTHGHATGDLLLQQIAQRLTSSVREGDSVARFGADEFVVVLQDLSEQLIEAAEETEAVCNKILAVLNRPYQLANYEYQCTASIGATLFNDHQQKLEELVKQADIAMYHAKKSGRNNLRFFDPEMQEVIDARAVLERELRQAFKREQFHLYYQIQVDDSGRPIGAEALIRWLHPDRGLVSPAQFIPLAEETDLILPLGRWVLEAACAQLKAWERDEMTRNLVLAVNISAKQFYQADFVANVLAAIHFHAINPTLLKLELTESILVDDIEETITTMKALKETGVKFSLDDFGTGYSSLQYLKRLPLDQLKIDQSFVRDIATDSSDKAIVHTIIAMAHSLNLDVIAEGVETKEQRQFLLNKGCLNYQGYLFGKPVPIEQFETSLKQA